MKKYSFLRWIVVLTVTWLVLNGTFNWLTLLSGVLISLIILKFTEIYLLGSPYYQWHHFKFLSIFKYSIFMIIEIYISGFRMVGMIFSHKINMSIVEIQTDLEKEYQRILLANSITLTPGTITADLTGNKLTVLWINKTSEDPDQIKKSISQSIEERLRNL